MILFIRNVAHNNNNYSGNRSDQSLWKALKTVFLQKNRITLIYVPGEQMTTLR